MSAAISSSVRPSAAVRVMNPPTGPGRRALQNALQPQTFLVAGDLPRHAHVFERRHVNDVAARQRDVRSDARALLAQRLLGDLDDDLLAFFEQIGDGRLPVAAAGRAIARSRDGPRLRSRRARCVARRADVRPAAILTAGSLAAVRRAAPRRMRRDTRCG